MRTTGISIHKHLAQMISYIFEFWFSFSKRCDLRCIIHAAEFPISLKLLLQLTSCKIYTFSRKHHTEWAIPCWAYKLLLQHTACTNPYMGSATAHTRRSYKPIYRHVCCSGTISLKNPLRKGKNVCSVRDSPFNVMFPKKCINLWWC